MRQSRQMAVAGMLVASLTIACGKSDRTEVSGGDVLSDSTYRALDYEVSSDGYRRWLHAQAALDSVDAGQPIRIDIRRATSDDVDRVVDALEDRPRERAAIESSGMKVRDFVLTSIALAQSWDAVNRPESRLTGVPVGNVDLLRNAPEGQPLSSRPKSRVLADDDSDSDSERPKKRRGRGRGSDSDS